MAYLVELPLGERGDTVKVTIVEPPADGLVQVARPGQVVARATRSLGELLSGIRPVAENFVDTFRGTARGPDEISVEFGLSLSAEADVVISSTSAQANFMVRLAWNRCGPQRRSAEDAAAHASSEAPNGQVTHTQPGARGGSA